jgi:hypothetical protein
MGQLFLRNKADVDVLLNVAADHGLAMTRDAVECAREMLSDDWLTLFAMSRNCICDLSIGKSGSVGYSLPQWAEVAESLYALRSAEGITEQARRLRVPAHERLDTAFAVTVAGRYKSRGWGVTFEPNGKGCSDLQLAQESRNFYVEVKRENTQEHVRSNNFHSNANAILSALPPALSEWLDKNDCRIQVKFPRGLSHSLVTRICNELSANVPHAPIGVVRSLTLPRGSEFVLLHRDSDQHYRMGFVGRIMLKAGVPVQLNDPRNTPVQIGFDWPPNLSAIRALIKKANRQLQNDATLSSGTTGFIVMQARGGEQLAMAIEQRFLRNFPPCCSGVTLVSEIPFESGQIVCRDAVDAKTLEVMSYAASFPDSLVGHALCSGTSG